MKILIDMPEEEYKDVVDDVFFFVGHLVDAIKNGTPISDNATNQEKYIEIFGIDAWKQMIVFSGLADQFKEFWTSPYQKGNKE